MPESIPNSFDMFFKKKNIYLFIEVHNMGIAF